MPPPRHAVLAEGLRKRLQDTQALDGLRPRRTPRHRPRPARPQRRRQDHRRTHLSPPAVRADGGRAQVAGYDVATQPRLVRRRIGLTGQQTAVDDTLTARQNLVMFGRLFHMSKADARARAEELLAQFGLAEPRTGPPKTFSGGMRRRLDLASSMLLAPEVLFLDEPTTGLDPAGRREVWQTISGPHRPRHHRPAHHPLPGRGRQALRPDQRHRPGPQPGRGHPDRAQAAHRQRAARGGRHRAGRPAGARGAAGQGATTAVSRRGRDGASVATPVAEGVRALTEIAAELRHRGISVADLGVRRPTLDEAFLHLTGSTRGATTGADNDTAAPARTTTPEAVK